MAPKLLQSTDSTILENDRWPRKWQKNLTPRGSAPYGLTTLAQPCLGQAAFLRKGRTLAAFPSRTWSR